MEEMNEIQNETKIQDNVHRHTAVCIKVRICIICLLPFFQFNIYFHFMNFTKLKKTRTYTEASDQHHFGKNSNMKWKKKKNTRIFCVRLFTFSVWIFFVYPQNRFIRSARKHNFNLFFGSTKKNHREWQEKSFPAATKKDEENSRALSPVWYVRTC